jgi:hypothetical protein
MTGKGMSEQLPPNAAVVTPDASSENAATAPVPQARAFDAAIDMVAPDPGQTTLHICPTETCTSKRRVDSIETASKSANTCVPANAARWLPKPQSCYGKK